jgi:2'-5' RNA ligase
MELSIGSLGAFPNTRHPRVLWAGVEAPPELSSLQRGIETRTTKIGYPKDKRAFSPHLTLGRVSRNCNAGQLREISDMISSNKIGFLGAACVQSLHIYKSVLTPNGAVYTKLFSAPFGDAEN